MEGNGVFWELKITFDHQSKILNYYSRILYKISLFLNSKSQMLLRTNTTVSNPS